MKIKQNYDLSEFNTFGIQVYAEFFAEIKHEDELGDLFGLPEFKNNKRIFLGGGSNVLFTEDFKGLVILNKLKGIEILEENSETVTLRALGGENWHQFVLFSVNRGYWGLENLSLIPGTVAAAPMQNIGAYGVEIESVLENVETYEIETGQKKIFRMDECELGYRDSIFKNKLKGKYFISAIVVKLRKEGKGKTDYKVLKEHLEKNKIEVKEPKDVSRAVVEIRQSKLPDPKDIGNAGSFFKNVFVVKEKLDELLQIYPAMPYFVEEEVFKIPAAWLIEQCGWKGHKEGNVGVHHKQALVLVNYGGGKGKEILELAYKIIASVKEKFGLELQPEVNIV